jgi:hypothetical protein
LDGRFEVAQAQFSKAATQEKVDELSSRGRGQPDAAEAEAVASNFQGQFKLDAGVITFQNLGFRMPGVALTLSGTYGLEDSRIDLRGTARLEAKPSQTATGFKSLLLKAVDPFVKKGGAGTVLPIKITGTRDSPSFGLNLGGAKR